MSAKLSPDTTHRKCSRCRVVLPLEAFNKASSKPLGRAYECRECQRALNHAQHERSKGRSKPTEREVDQGRWPVPAMDLMEQLACVRFRKWRGPVDTSRPLAPMVKLVLLDAAA